MSARLPFTLIYLVDRDGLTARLVAQSGVLPADRPCLRRRNRGGSLRPGAGAVIARRRRLAGARPALLVAGTNPMRPAAEGRKFVARWPNAHDGHREREGQGAGARARRSARGAGSREDAVPQRRESRIPYAAHAAAESAGRCAVAPLAERVAIASCCRLRGVRPRAC